MPLFLSAEKSHRLFPILFSGPPQRFASFELRAAGWHRRVAGGLKVRGGSLERRSSGWPVTQKQQQEQILKTLS